MKSRVIEIRPVRPTDADAWLALRGELWPEEDEASLEAAVARFFVSPGGKDETLEEVLVAVESGARATIVGFAEVSRRAYAEGCDTSPVGFLEGWYVKPGLRRQGIGRALVGAAESWARAKGCREFASDAVADNAVSAAAHQALGFEEVVVIRCFRKDLLPLSPGGE